MDVYDERQGREFPLFYCVCVIGALCTMRCLHHRHTPLATTKDFTFAAVAGEPSVPPDGRALANKILSKPVLVFAAAFGPSDLQGSPPSLFSYLEDSALKGKAVGRRRF